MSKKAKQYSATEKTKIVIEAVNHSALQMQSLGLQHVVELLSNVVYEKN